MIKALQPARLHWISTGRLPPTARSPWRARLLPTALLIVAVPTGMAAAQTPERAPPLPPGQVWQCVHDGHKIFSDAPCGSGATIRQLNDVNVMDPAPATRVPGYPPRVANSDYPAPYRGDEPQPGIATGAEAEDAADGPPVYGTQVVGIANRWQRVRHAPRPLHRARPAARAPAAHSAAR